MRQHADKAADQPSPKLARTAGAFWSALASDAWRRGNAAPDPAEALRWLDRARRILPQDDMVGLSLALAHFRAGEMDAAAALFAGVAERWDVLEAWSGLAASALRLGDPARAARAMAAALPRHATAPALHPLAQAVAKAAGYPGWCAVDAAGCLYADLPADVSVDGTAVAVRWRGGRCRVPPGGTLAVSRGGAPLLGSPIELTAIAACEGFVALSAAGDLVGWAWHPNNPAKPPMLTVAGSAMVLRAMSSETLDRPLARPRRLHVPAGELPKGLVEVLGPDGRSLLGSPVVRLRPGRRTLMPRVSLTPALSQGEAERGRPRPAVHAPPDVVVPIYRGLATTMACLRAVLSTLPQGSRLHIVNDASPDPALTAAVRTLSQDPRIDLIELDRNGGFPRAANAGLRAASGRDVALLNSDALVAPGWLEALGAALHSAPDIASACPLSNEATILSYPNLAGGNPAAEPQAMAALAQRANRGATVEIPVAVGFCMVMRQECLNQVGLFREDVFAQGYGEENDWSLRARQHGWRHVAALGCYVAHEGGASFGPARRHLLERNTALLERLHPGYNQMIGDWIAQDSLGPARRRMDALRWATGRRPASVVFITHEAGGGVDRVVTARAAACVGAGLRPIVIRPSDGAAVVGDGSTPNLRFRLPAEWESLLGLLRADAVARVELHHTLGHAAVITELAARLGVPQEVFVHDYAWFCPRIALVAAQTYCGEPDLAGCERCIETHGSHLDEPTGAVELVARSGRLLAAATRVVVPTPDVARRMRRHFPQLQPEVSRWEDDAAIPPPIATGAVRHVVVVGGIGVEKGYRVLLGCVTDAGRRGLKLRYTVVGSTADDEELLAAGPVFITGRYQDGEVDALIRAQQADIALLPSIWPETWCFTLGHAWRAGLRAVVFDLGSPAERVRRTGWGHVLPLGLPPAALNDWLLRLCPTQAGLAAACQTPSHLQANPAI